MERLNRFRGIVEFDVKDEHVVLSSMTMNDVFDMIQLSKSKRKELINGVDLFSNILYRSYPNESLEDIRQFILGNYSTFVDGLVISLGWTTKEGLEKIKDKESIGKKKISMALFKARMAAEADKSSVEDSYITNCYIIMREFKYTIDTILKLPASHFNILIEEMVAQSKREETEQRRNKTLRK